MSISNFIESIPRLAELPLEKTENSDNKIVRVIGVLGFSILFIPVMLLFIVIGGLLAIPAMIQDA